jgi:hypothetical protein
MSNDLLEKVISTTSIGADGTHGGGLLSPQQSGRFIDYMWNATTLGSQVRTIRMRSNEVELDRMAIGERLVRVATEAVDDGRNVAVAFSKVSLGTVKLRLDWELSSEALEDGIEGDALEEHIARLMAAQAANDLEDLAINGDVIGHQGDALLKAFDGWRKRLFYGGRVLDAGSVKLPDGTLSNTLHRGTFNAALRAMPRRFMDRRGALKFFTATGLVQDFMYNAQIIEPNDSRRFATGEGVAATNDNNPGVSAGWSPASPYGVALQEVPLFPEYDVDFNAASSGLGTPGTGQTAGKGSDLWLVDPQNLIWGVVREIQVFREFKPKKDTIEYTLYTRVGANVENPQASVIVKNVAYQQ